MAEIIQVGTTTQSAGSNNRRKRTFQSSLQNSRKLKRMWSGELDDKIRALRDLGQRAEADWWDMTRTEFAKNGTVVFATALAHADGLCAGAVTMMNQILHDISDITDVPHVALDWTKGDPLNQSLYTTYLTEDCDALLERVVTMRTMMEGVHDYEMYASWQATWSGLYDWVKQEFSDYGPNFPTPLTDYFTNSARVKYLHPHIVVSVEQGLSRGDLHNLLYLSNCVEQQFENTGGTYEVFAAGTGGTFHEIGVGDTVALTRLTTEEGIYNEYVGQQFSVLDVGDGEYGTDLVLEQVNDGVVIDLAIQGEDKTAWATTFGENFELRKIKGAT